MDQPSAEFRNYRAFISYNHRDESWGRWLHRGLERYRVPKRLIGKKTAVGDVPASLAPIFRDREDLSSGSNLSESIRGKLEHSSFLIVICSPQAAKSRWVNEEVRAFQRLGRADRILCLIVDGEPNASNEPGHEHLECFCPALLEQRDADGKCIEPLAADARKSGDGRKPALLKIAAGLLGVDYDALRQREQQRRQRQLLGITVASVAGMVFTISLTVFAIRARDDAQNEREQAEGLVEFMLGDLREKLEPVGRLDTLDAVGAKALSYYASQRLKNLDTASLSRRSRALHLIGEMRDLRGDINEAESAFAEAARTTEEQLVRFPDDTQCIFDHAQSMYWVGYIAWQRGQSAAAEGAWQQYKALAQSLVAIDAGKHDWKVELGNAHTNLAAVMMQQGRLDEAAAELRQGLLIFQDLVAAVPDNWEFRHGLGQSHAWLADTEEQRGLLRDATLNRQAELAAYAPQLSHQPTHADALNFSLVAHLALSRLGFSTGNLETSSAEAARALAIAQALVATDDSNTFSQELLAQALLNEARLRIHARALGAARQNLVRAQEIAEKLVGRDATMVSWRTSLLSVSALLMAEHLTAQTNLPSAIKTARDTLSSLEAFQIGHAFSDPDKLRLAYARSVVADLEWRNQQIEVSRKLWAQVLQDISSLTGVDIFDLEEIRITALCRLGRQQDAQRHLAQIEQLGYRSPRVQALRSLVAEKG